MLPFIIIRAFSVVCFVVNLPSGLMMNHTLEERAMEDGWVWCDVTWSRLQSCAFVLFTEEFQILVG